MSMLPYFYDMERPFRMMEREFFRPDFAPFQMVPREFFAPWRRWDNALRSWENSFRPFDMIKPFEELSDEMRRLGLNEVGKITSDDEKFQVNVDVQHFAPEEINVKVIDGQVIVQGKHEEKQDDHGYVSRQFIRRYALPQGCLPDTVQSKLSSDGVLTVTAPKVLPLPSTGERIVPISHTGPIKKISQNQQPSIQEGK